MVAIQIAEARPASAGPTFDSAAQILADSTFTEARRVANWVASSKDNRNIQYIIIDKTNARLFLFDQSGKLQTTTPILLGVARGDNSPSGIGKQKLSSILPQDRITPSGRFVSGAGEDVSGKDLIWLDYDAAIALHRASDRKPGMGVRSRVERLSAIAASERRVSLGCVNVSTAFYDTYLKATFGASKGIIYILPETRSATDQFHIPAIVAG